MHAALPAIIDDIEHSSGENVLALISTLTAELSEKIERIAELEQGEKTLRKLIEDEEKRHLWTIDAATRRHDADASKIAELEAQIKQLSKQHRPSFQD